MNPISRPRLFRDATNVAKGLATCIPGVLKLAPRKGTGGTDAAPYCYGVWLKHLTLLHSNGFKGVPECVAEIGPGDSLGVGIAALLSGARRYRALDVVPYANKERTLRILDELLVLFRARSKRPTKGWPDFDVHLGEGLFPKHILSDQRLSEALRDERVTAIRAAVSTPGKSADGIEVTYAVPWTDKSVVQANEVDLLLSHSVLEHVTDLQQTYLAMERWLRPGGWMTHQIDLTSHGLCEKWNGHRAYSDLVWKLIVGKRPFLINREPPSMHIMLMRQHGFDIVCEMALRMSGSIERSELAARWHTLSDSDLNTASMFVQACKSRGEKL